VASSAFSWLLTVVITVAPAQVASWMAALPTAPAPPATSTVRPARLPGAIRSGPRSAIVRHRCAVIAGMPMLAPSSKDALSGNGTACRAGSTTYSCAVPSGRCQAASQSHTRWPTVSATSGPTASTTPAPSWLGTISPSGSGVARRAFQSVGFTPEMTTLTRTSPGPGSGTGRSTRSNPSPLRA
jgi:hypothetical protein